MEKLIKKRIYGKDTATCSIQYPGYETFSDTYKIIEILFEYINVLDTLPQMAKRLVADI